MLEIYNESLRDLLSDDQSNLNRLDILNTQASGCNVPNAVQLQVCAGLPPTCPGPLSVVM